MGSMPQFDIASLEENAERIDGQVEGVKAKIRQEVEAKVAIDKTIMALGDGVDRLEADAKKLRRLADEIRQAGVKTLLEGIDRGDVDDRQVGHADYAGNGRAT